MITVAFFGILHAVSCSFSFNLAFQWMFMKPSRRQCECLWRPQLCAQNSECSSSHVLCVAVLRLVTIAPGSDSLFAHMPPGRPLVTAFAHQPASLKLYRYFAITKINFASTSYTCNNITIIISELIICNTVFNYCKYILLQTEMLTILANIFKCFFYQQTRELYQIWARFNADEITKFVSVCFLLTKMCFLITQT